MNCCCCLLLYIILRIARILLVWWSIELKRGDRYGELNRPPHTGKQRWNLKHTCLRIKISYCRSSLCLCFLTESPIIWYWDDTSITIERRLQKWLNLDILRFVYVDHKLSGFCIIFCQL